MDQSLRDKAYYKIRKRDSLSALTLTFIFFCQSITLHLTMFVML